MTTTATTTMRLGDLVGRHATRVVPASMDLLTAATTMAEDGIGALLVAGAGPRGRAGPAGIVTERDIVRAIATGAELEVERVADVMTDQVVTVVADASVATATSVMAQSQIRHLVVVAADGDVVGVVSARDVMAAWATTPATIEEVHHGVTN